MISEIQVRTILQHSWAEMEHDISYKSDQQIPNELQRRFLALAGLLEIADREFNSIQKEDERLRKKLEFELAEDIEKLASEGKSTSTPIQIDRKIYLSSQINEYKQNKTLLNALGFYNKLIHEQPNQHLHFLGRAKAKFLLGDRSGALEDIAKASTLTSEDDNIAIIRQQIEEGLVDENSSFHAEASKYLTLGNKYLEKGDATEAYSNYDKADQLGIEKNIIYFSYAMCACLRKDITEVKRNLAQFVPTPDSDEHISYLILKLLTQETTHGEVPELISLTIKLASISGTSSYDIEKSPLHFLKLGFEQKFGKSEAERLNRAIISALKQ